MPLSLSTPTGESLTRPRIAVALISAAAAVSFGYYAYLTTVRSRVDATPGSSLRRSNAVRRHRRSNAGATPPSSTDDPPPDEDAENADENENILPAVINGELPIEIDNTQPLPPVDAETVVGGADDWWNDGADIPPSQRAGHNIVNLLFRVSEDNARRTGCVHRGCQCNSCGMVPIRGVRYRCANCADFDLCETCEAQGVHIKTHIFYKIRVPAPPFGPRQMQPVWYTGDPDSCRRSLPKALMTKLSRESGFERPELEAIWEQWTFMANTEWRDDPDELGIAMDRKTFERCLVPTGGSRHAVPNLIHDRMFHFYDTNRDDLISFPEFLQGLAYRNRKDKIHKVFQGYDLDGDGHVDRKDFLRMFRAYYVLFKQMHKDILEGLQDQLLASTETSQLVTSRQPLSSLFGREGRVPDADDRVRTEGKTLHTDGRVDVAPGFESAVVPDRRDVARREEILTSLFAWSDGPGRRHPFHFPGTSNGGWQTVPVDDIPDIDRRYWVTLLDPPTTLDELPSILTGATGLDDFDDFDDNNDEEDHNENDVDNQNPDEPNTTSRTESEIRAHNVAKQRERVPKLEKRRRDMARMELHNRWKRRQFYLDQEEGGIAPEDWTEDEDVLDSSDNPGQSSKAPNGMPNIHRRHSENGLFYDGYIDNIRPELFEEEAVHEGSHTHKPPPSAEDRELKKLEDHFREQDAGKEILYQVTQQAFNELLDTIFKPGEDLAIQAAETKAQREEYQHLIDAIDESEIPSKNDDWATLPEENHMGEKDPGDKSLVELLKETGYTVAIEGRHAVDLGTGNPFSIKEEPEEDETSDAAEEEYRDPTMPQFRPNAATEPPIADEPPAEPTREQLLEWKRLGAAEESAKAHGGWGKLNFAEFEEIYRTQEQQGNRLDYLGSWIDFCIP